MGARGADLLSGLLPPLKKCDRNTRQAQIKHRVLLCCLSAGAFEPFGKRLRTFFNLVFSPLVAAAGGSCIGTLRKLAGRSDDSQAGQLCLPVWVPGCRAA